MDPDLQQYRFIALLSIELSSLLPFWLLKFLSLLLNGALDRWVA